MNEGLYFTCPHRDLERSYDIDREIVTCRNFTECTTKSQEVLANLERASWIRAAGAKRVRIDHTYLKRSAQVLSLAQIISGREGEMLSRESVR
jgi:hypothetical protein